MCSIFLLQKENVSRSWSDDIGIEMPIVDCIQFRWHGSRGPVYTTGKTWRFPLIFYCKHLPIID